jgi:hypothetical protein
MLPGIYPLVDVGDKAVLRICAGGILLGTWHEYSIENVVSIAHAALHKHGIDPARIPLDIEWLVGTDETGRAIWKLLCRLMPVVPPADAN